jgi:Fe-S-cluster containining protein
MLTISSKKITNCMRCGTCCKKGGPVLHHEDKKILREGHIGYQHLITIRKGERAYNPVKEMLEPIPTELVKIAGKSFDRPCLFYDESTAFCEVYRSRFLECRLLKCWDTAEIRAVMGKDTIRRSDIINPDDPVIELIEKHEQACPYNEIEGLITALSGGRNKAKAHARMKELVHNDLYMREFAFRELDLKKEFELFIFGRPLTKVLEDRGLKITMGEGKRD